MKKEIKIHWLITISVFFYIICILPYAKANNIKNSAVVFMYHKFDNSKYPTTNVTINQLEDHIKEFSSGKYNVLSLNYIIDILISDLELPANTIAITVDDADKSFVKVAWPRFKEKKIPVTLFVNTGGVGNGKNSLDWDDLRKLKSDGVNIGAHSHMHDHMPELSIEEMKNEIENSNKIFLREIGEIPNIFAYPYGETNTELINLIKSYRFKSAFGQHSGVINDTSNLFYLPRFSLNEKYADIDRVKFIANNKGIGIYDFVPANPQIKENPPYIGFSLLDQKLSYNLNCFVFDSKGSVGNEMFKFNERIEIRLKRKLSKGRTRLNCTVKDSQGNWRWYGSQFYF